MAGPTEGRVYEDLPQRSLCKSVNYGVNRVKRLEHQILGVLYRLLQPMSLKDREER